MLPYSCNVLHEGMATILTELEDGDFTSPACLPALKYCVQTLFSKCDIKEGGLKT